MIWMVVLGAIAALVVYRSMRKPVDVLDEMAETAGVPKEVLQMIGEEENKTKHKNEIKQHIINKNKNQTTKDKL